jgi:RNA polymerase sigma-70 factor (ECF subfamily)
MITLNDDSTTGHSGTRAETAAPGASAEYQSDAAATAASIDSAREAAYDAKLVAQFRSGREQAFVEIMERYRRRIFGLAQNLLRNVSDAEEITQDTFIRAHRGLAEFRGDSSLATWLYRIALNLSRNRYWYFFRRRRQDSISLELSLGEDSSATFSDLIAAESRSPLQETVTQEFTDLVARCMEKLDPTHREILTMRNILNLPYEEIANTIGINVGTVKSRIARARENLRKLMVAEAPEFGPEPTGGADFFEHSRTVHGCFAIAYA